MTARPPTASRAARALAAAVATLLLTAPGAASLPTPAAGSFGINPSRRHVLGEPGASLTPTNVINTTAYPYKVSVFPVLLTQQLAGSFNFSTDPTSLAQAAQLLSVSPASFVLKAGQEFPVHLHWSSLPRGQSEMTIGVVFQGLPAHQTGPVRIITRLLSVNFLRLPGDVAILGRFGGLGATQVAPRVLRFLPRVINTGRRAWAPSHATFSITNADRHVVYRTGWVGDVVIPGAQREFPIDVTKILPAGQYTMAATMRFGGTKRVVGRFTLAGPNQLPTPDIAIPYFNAVGSVGTPAVVAVKVLSTGTAPANLSLHLALSATGGPAAAAHVAADSTLNFHQLRPGAARRRLLSLGPSLAAGAYEVTGTWSTSAAGPQTVESSFTAVVKPSAISRLRSWITGHLTIIVAVVVVGLMFFAFRRRQRALEAELARARNAAAPKHDPEAPN